MGTEHLDVRGQEARIHGIAPHKSIDLDVYHGQSIPMDWDIKAVSGDIIMATYVDEDSSGELVNRGGILVNTNTTKGMWRIIKVEMVGPGVPEEYGVGTYLMVPNDKGLPLTKFGGKNMLFINADRVFCVMTPKNNI